MARLVIATSWAAEDLAARLQSALAGEACRGVNPALRRETSGPLDCFIVTLEGPAAGFAAGPAADAAYGALAGAVRGHIFSSWPTRLARCILARRYPSFTAAEATQVVNAVERETASFEGGRLGPEVAARALECLHARGGVAVDGLVRFRLRGFARRVAAAAERAAAEAVLDRQYRDFLRVLRRFVESQRPRLAELHVQIDSGASRFRLVDRAGRPLPSETLTAARQRRGVARDRRRGAIHARRWGAARQGRRHAAPRAARHTTRQHPPAPVCPFPAGPPGGGWMPAKAADYEDLLVSTLVMAAPGRIVIHLGAREAPSLGGQLRALAGVFGGRLVLCPGCALCRAHGG